MKYRRVFEIVFIFSFIFPALAFGGIEPLPSAIMQLLSLGIFTAFMFSRLRRNRLKLYYSVFLIPLLAFFTLCLVQFAFLKTNPFQSCFFPYTLYRYPTRNVLLLMLSYFLFFYTAVHSFKNLRQVGRLVLVIGVFGFTLSLFSIVQKISGTTSAYWIRKMPGGFYGPFFNENNMSNYLMMIFLLLLGYSIYLWKKRDPGLQFIPLGSSCETRQAPVSNGNGNNSAPLPLLIFFLAVILAAIIYSGSRAGIIITIFCSCFVGIVSFRRRIQRRAIIVLLVVLVLVSGTTMALWALRQPMYTQKDTASNLSQLELRGPLWKHSLDAIKRNPLFGSGLGTYQEAIKSFVPWDFPTARRNRYITHAHNDYIELLSDTGIVGFILFISFVALFACIVVKKLIERRRPFACAIGYSGVAVMLAMALHSFLDFNLRIPANGFLFAGICAMTHFTVHSHNNGKTSLKFFMPVTSGQSSMVIGTVIIVLCVLLSFLIVLPVVSKALDPIKVDDAKGLARLESSDFNILYPRLRMLTYLDPLNSEHAFHLAKVCENEVRRLLRSRSGVVFDDLLYGRISTVFKRYRDLLDVHGTGGYYHMSLGFFAMRFVDHPELTNQFAPDIPLPELERPAYVSDGKNVFIDMCYAHLHYATMLDPSNPNLNRGLYMGCFYLYKRVLRNKRPEDAERLLALGKESCRKYLEIMPYFYDKNGKEYRSAEEALRFFARHVSTERDYMYSILPAKSKYRDYYVDKIRKEFVHDE